MSQPTSTQPPFRIDVSSRIARLPPYLFGRINKTKYEKRVAGIDIIDLGMGNPTDPTPDSVVEAKLAEAARDPRGTTATASATASPACAARWPRSTPPSTTSNWTPRPR